ncbi:MAG: citryl-CoA lyase [Betaproteobacteria bacterium HGW-Betaproteobacteria-7]|jgi:citrate synthase|nr:MAG: citryl-CoA lyase [Betaproteobacteria bacterium HGW-Betaproteobacteria-7]
MTAESKDIIHSRLWEEEAADADPFTADACYCSGYDVYGEVLEHATYPEYLYLLFRGERPSAQTARALEILAIAIANPGPRDPSVHAAMCAGVGGSPGAAALMAALAAGAGVSGGAREVFLSMQLWAHCADHPAAWHEALTTPPAAGRMQVWPDAEHPPGFAAHGQHCSLPVRQTLQALAACCDGGCIGWLATHRETLELISGRPLAMTGLLAAALTDLGFAPAAGEMLTLLLRLPGAAAHALEQEKSGIRHFPFFALDITNDPGPRAGQ